MIKNVILDVGRVLVAWQPKQKWKEWGFSDETILGLSQALFDSGVWNEVDRGVMGDDEFLTFAIEQAPQYEQEIRLFWERVGEAIWQFPYAKDWIRAMKAAGYRVYILSNYGNWTYEKTREKALNFLDDVDGAVFSYQVKQIKPEPEIFHSLMEKYDLKAEECVFLDDLASNIDGAKAVGMQGIVFTGLEDALMELEKLGVMIKM